MFERKPDQVEELDAWREDLWSLIETAPNLDWLLLTKRPENVLGMTPLDWPRGAFPANVWIGVSVENQKYADERIPELLKIPAAVRFLSCEPLLGPIDLSNDSQATFCNFAGHLVIGDCGHDLACRPRGFISGLDWIIARGESGPNARPMHPDWARHPRPVL